MNIPFVVATAVASACSTYLIASGQTAEGVGLMALTWAAVFKDMQRGRQVNALIKATREILRHIGA